MNSIYIYIFFTLQVVVTISHAQTFIKDGYYASANAKYNSQGKDFICFADQSFKFLRVTDVEDGYGVGSYDIKGDTLTLSFKSHPKQPNFVIKTLDAARNDSVLFDITVQDKRDYSGMVGVTVRHERTGNRMVTDKEGKGTLAFGRGELLLFDTLKASFIGYSDEEIPISSEMGSHQSVLIRLASGYYYFDADDSLKYKVKKMDSSFVLTIYDYPVEFKRISKSRFRKAVRRFRKLTGE